MRYFVDLSYRGTAFHGWQLQPNAHTVQAEVQDALSTILQKPMEVTGSGRTDAGVHAVQQVAHFDAELSMKTDQLIYRLNGLLPPEVSINAIQSVKPDAHARFDAGSRAYQYLIHQKKNPFKEGLSYYFPKALSAERIREALPIINSWKNFQAFSKVHTDVNHFDCEIFDLWWEETNDGYQFSVSANRFLRGMVRAMVGTLLEIGLGRMTYNELKAVLESGNRSLAGRAVPPHGLYLAAVKYPSSVYIEAK